MGEQPIFCWGFMYLPCALYIILCDVNDIKITTLQFRNINCKVTSQELKPCQISRSKGEDGEGNYRARCCIDFGNLNNETWEVRGHCRSTKAFIDLPFTPALVRLASEDYFADLSVYRDQVTLTNCQLLEDKVFPRNPCAQTKFKEVPATFICVFISRKLTWLRVLKASSLILLLQAVQLGLEWFRPHCTCIDFCLHHCL